MNAISRHMSEIRKQVDGLFIQSLLGPFGMLDTFAQGAVLRITEIRMLPISAKTVVLRCWGSVGVAFAKYKEKLADGNLEELVE